VAREDGMTVENRIAVVTGAGTFGEGVGIGKAISVVLARHGARLVLADIDADRVAETAYLVAKEGADATTVLGDVSVPADCQRIVEAAVSRFGTVDILVNNAAASIPGTVLSLSDDDWAAVLGVSLLGAVRMSRYAVPLMAAQQRGSIVNISSISSTASSRTAAYASAKGGLEALTRDMAVTHGRDGIRVNAVLPGYLKTPRVKRVSQGTQAQLVLTDQTLRNAAGPLGTEGTAWDVAWAVEYLASDRAQFVTGVSLPVDGGVLATSYMSMAPVIEEEGVLKEKRQAE
jgi:NAD(P)-dependent dehydrogenase (short-subunit alcohol dehydrogenase family)